MENIIKRVKEIREWLQKEKETMDAIFADCTVEQRVLDEAKLRAPQEPLQRWALGPRDLIERIRKKGIPKHYGDSGELGEYPIICALKVHSKWASYGPDDTGCYMLHYLCRNWIERGCKLSPELLDATVSAFPDAAKQSDRRYGQLPLHTYCCSTKKCLEPRLVTMLCKAFPAAAATEDKVGNLPLHSVFMNRSLPEVSIKPKALVAIIMSNSEAVVTQRRSDGATPLHLLCKNTKIVEKLGVFGLRVKYRI